MHSAGFELTKLTYTRLEDKPDQPPGRPATLRVTATHSKSTDKCPATDVTAVKWLKKHNTPDCCVVRPERRLACAADCCVKRPEHKLAAAAPE